jgi:hypothetical protein
LLRIGSGINGLGRLEIADFVEILDEIEEEIQKRLRKELTAYLPVGIVTVRRKR